MVYLFFYENVCPHLRDVFIHIHRVTFVHIHDRNTSFNICGAPPLCIIRSQLPLYNFWTEHGLGGWPKTKDPKHKC